MGASPLPGLTRVNLVRGVAGRSVSVGGGGARGALALAGSAEGTVLNCTASSAPSGASISATWVINCVAQSLP